MTTQSKSPLAVYSAELERAIPTIRKVLPTTIAKYLTPERIVKVALLSMRTTPELMLCTTDSVLRSVIYAAELGLEPSGGALGHAHLVPYNRKDKKTGRFFKEAQLIIGYRGYILLSRRSGDIQSVESHVVHERDSFELRYGINPVLSHAPLIVGDRGAPIGAYSVARFKDGGYHVEFMTIPEIDSIRKRSKASEYGPWVTDYSEMARKTVIRRAAKYWPISVEMAKAFEIDDSAESGIAPDFDFESPAIEPEALPESTAVDTLREKLELSAETRELEGVPANG